MTSYYKQFLLAALMYLFTFLAMLVVDKLGRTPLILWVSGGLAILYIIVVQLLDTASPVVAWFLLSPIGISLPMSLAPITWALISEIFPDKVREADSSMAVISLSTAYFPPVFTFAIPFEKLQDKSFTAICLI